MFSIWRGNSGVVRIEADGDRWIDLPAEDIGALTDELSALVSAPRDIEQRKRELRRLYVDEGLSPASIGRRWGVSAKKISVWLTTYGIPAHSEAKSASTRRWQAARKAGREAAQ